MKIGIVDLDTSHPTAFAKIIDQVDGMELSGVWDAGDVQPEGFKKAFAEKWDVSAVYENLETMAGEVDAAMILSANWEKHIERALPFIKAGRPVLIDKPVIGSVKDAKQLLEIQKKYNARIFGGSSLRFAQEVQDIRSKIKDERLISVYASGPGELFNYGIHTVEMVQQLTGAGAKLVQCIRSGNTKVFSIEFGSGAHVSLQLGSPVYEWVCVVTTDKSHYFTMIDQQKLYSSYLAYFAMFVQNKSFTFDVELTVEATRILIAADQSAACGKPVLINGLAQADGFDGSAFVRSYKVM